MVPVLFAMLANVWRAAYVNRPSGVVIFNSYGGMVRIMQAPPPVIFGVGYNDIKSSVAGGRRN